MVAEHRSSEQISERICEQIADVRVPQVVEQVLEAPKISSQDRNLQGTVEEIPDVLVPEMVVAEYRIRVQNPAADRGAHC